jgi:phage N-6-adenine-methyltransferase
MGVPKQKPGQSKQDYGTPRDFLDAIEARWGNLDVDLACREDNKKAPIAVTAERNSLLVPWAKEFPDLNLWLNPPFGHIEPWAEKCAYEGQFMRRGKIFLLTPASIGANWYEDHVIGKAMVLGLGPRMIFEGANINPKTGKSDPYPKDLSLSIFAPGIHGHGFWRWKDNKR